MVRRHIKKAWAAALALALVLHETSGAVFYLETFDTPPPGWSDRDPGEMLVSHTSGFGNPAGSMRGAFDPQSLPLPEVDAFRITQSEFMGNYWLTVPGFTAWAFDFYADDVLPSDLTIRFSNGINTFFRSATAQVTATGVWAPVSIPLTYAGWVGGSATAFSNALSNVVWIDIQISRSGIGAQEYYVDNFQLLGSGDSVIPEPGTAALMLCAFGLIAMIRKKRGILTRI
jgi:hypothetical protein